MMKGYILFLIACSVHSSAAAVFGDTCTINDDCTESGQVCDNTCVCYTENNYIRVGNKCVKELGRDCTITAECNDVNVICDSNGKCQCNKATHYDSNGDTSLGGACTAKHVLGQSCTNPAVAPNTVQCSDANADCKAVSGGTGYTCQCNDGFYSSGGNCVQDIDECSSSPCKNGGTCNNEVYRYTCSCVAGYTDTNCETNINECSSSPCSNGGTCNNGVNTYTCSCVDGYTGDRCEKNKNECSSNPCQNGGTCYDGVNRYTCGCVAGYTGINCGTNKNECSSNPCQNGGTCYDGVNRYTCGCVAGYTGINCGTNKNECSSNPCQNGGTCYDGVNRYTCGCVAGYTGINCGTNKNECSSNPCQNGGTCYDGVNRYTCRCVAGYTDTNCGTNIDDCSPHPCLNGGFCTDLVDDFTCSCKSGYTSETCSVADLGVSCAAAGTTCKDANAFCGTGNICICRSSYYDDNGLNSGGTCRQRKALGVQCSNIPNECADTNAACLDNKCTCGNNHYDNNGFNPDGSCENVSDLKVISITFQSVTTSGFKVSWTPPSGGKASHINNYEVEWSLKISDTSLRGGKSVVPASTTSFDISSGVTAGKTYNVKVISVNTNTRHGHNRTISLTSEQASKPNKPQSLTTPDLDATDQQITIGWSAPSSGVAISYRVQLFDGTSPLTSNDFQQTSGNIYYKNMKNGYHYDVKISARSEFYQGSSYEWSDIYVAKIKTTVQVPDPPTDLKCPTLRIFDKSIGLTWLAPVNKNGDIKGYKIEVLNSLKTLKKTLTTNGDVTEYTVPELDPGTRYFFRVYTVNENFTSSTFAASSNCDTEAPLAESPQNLSIFEIESRTSKMSWIQPVQIFSEENLGYSIQIKDEIVCIEEHIFTCSNCIQPITVSNLKGLCNTDVRNASQKTKDVLNDKQMMHMYKATKLFPDILYSANVAAISNKGKGNIATIEWKTKEEVPQKPYNIDVTEINATYLKVSWNIFGPRPGNTTFTVKLTAVGSAPSPEYKVIGFEQKSLMATQLEEFWNYTVTVTASTSVGFMRSDVSETYRTLPAAPGKVSSFRVHDAPREDYQKLKFVWKAPLELERNGVIKEYIYKHNASGALQTPQTLGQDADENHEYSVELNVVPEEYYTFEVFAVNEQNLNGEPTNQILQTKAGVPINVEEQLLLKVITASNNVENREKTRIAVTIVQDFFEESTYGKIRANGIIACVKVCELSDIKTLADFNSMSNWKQAVNGGFTPYRITSSSWLNILKTDKLKDKDVTYMDYTIGGDSCNNISPGEYCNGPLVPGTEYIFVAVTCTNGGCLLSNEYGPFFTLDEIIDDKCESQTVAVIIGVLLSAIIVVLALYAIYATLVIRRYKKSAGENEINKGQKRKGPIYANESFMMGIAEIGEGNKEATTNNSETEYSRLDENTRDDMTYERLQVL